MRRLQGGALGRICLQSEMGTDGDHPQTMNTFHKACDALHLRILSLLAISLDLSPDFFVSANDGRAHNLRLLHYPPAQRSGSPNRLGAHTDFGTVGLLAPSRNAALGARALSVSLSSTGHPAMARLHRRATGYRSERRLGQCDSQGGYVRDQHVSEPSTELSLSDAEPSLATPSGQWRYFAALVE